MKRFAILSLASSVLSSPQDGETGGNNCSPLHLLYARGTAEPAGPNNFGIQFGGPFINATREAVPGLTSYGIKYPANLDCDSREQGGADAVAHLTSQHAECPDQKFVLSGISQGADVIHFAAGTAPKEVYPSIVAIVLFGDPGHRGQDAINPLGDNSPAIPSELTSKLKQNCAHNDPVCTNNGTILAQHVTYGNANETYISSSVDFIRRQFESDGQAGPEPSPEDPGEQTDGNLRAILGLAETLNGIGVKQTCNGTTTSYIHPDLLATATALPASGSATLAASSAASTTALEDGAQASASASASSSPAAGNGGVKACSISLLSVSFMAMLCASFA